MRRLIQIVIAALLLLGLSTPASLAAPAAPAPEEPAGTTALFTGQLNITQVASGLVSPIGVVNAGDGTNRLFVIEKRGTVRVVSSGGTLQSGFFLDIRGPVNDAGSEQGLLGLAFHPGFESNRKLFVYYTNSAGDLVIAEMTANAARTSAGANTLDPIFASPIDHPSAANHNGGQLLFGPDGHLYIFTGDGGGSGDQFGNAQDIESRLGKILRVDPDLDGGADIPADNPYVGEAGSDVVWAIGLRNPWRASFDRDTDQLWIADVGQGSWEEINRVTNNVPGRNYMWSRCEGRALFNGPGPCDSSSGTRTAPIAQYARAGGHCAVTGGYVYRGDVFSDLAGQYVLGDFCSGQIWTIGASSSTLVARRNTSAQISSFGEAEDGELYMTDYAGRLYRVVAPPFTDVVNSQFIDHITWLAEQGITSGCGGTNFCPNGLVTRGQMATFLVRALGLPPTGTDYFTDDEGNTHEANINRLRAAGITAGCGGTNFCPDGLVTRGQMATFLVRGYGLPPTSTDYFTDDEGNTHEANINRLRASGITFGCGGTTFCPNGLVTRGQMAAFLYRAAD